MLTYLKEYAKAYTDRKQTIYELREELRETYYIKVQGREEAEANLAKIEKLENDVINNKLTLAIMEHNGNYLLYTDIAPKIIEIYKKYAGKPYGPKTKDKINKECQDTLGYSSYVYVGQHKTEFNVYLHTQDMRMRNINIDVHDYEHNYITEDNKINGEMEAPRWYSDQEFIDDIPAYINKLTESLKQVKEACTNYQSATSVFNSLAIGSIDRLDYVSDPKTLNTLVKA